jgi:hypothetical protein
LNVSNVLKMSAVFMLAHSNDRHFGGAAFCCPSIAAAAALA